MVELPDRAELESLIEQLYLHAAESRRACDVLLAGLKSFGDFRVFANEWIMAPKGDLAELPVHLFGMLLPFLDAIKADNYLQFTFKHADRDEMLGHFVVCRPHHSPDKLYKDAVADAEQLRADNAELKTRVIYARLEALREVAYQASLPSIPIAALRNVIAAMIDMEREDEVALSREQDREDELSDGPGSSPLPGNHDRACAICSTVVHTCVLRSPFICAECYHNVQAIRAYAERTHDTAERLRHALDKALVEAKRCADGWNALHASSRAEIEKLRSERDAALHDVALWKRQNTTTESALDDCRRLLDEARAQLDESGDPACIGEWSGGSGLHRKHGARCGAKAVTFDDPFWYCDEHSPMHRKLRRERDEALEELRIERAATDALIGIDAKHPVVVRLLTRERDQALGSARDRARVANILDEELCDQRQRTWDLQAVVEQVRCERDEWADAIRSVALGAIPSAVAARAAIEELKGKWRSAVAEADLLRVERDVALATIRELRAQDLARNICWHCYDQLARYDDERPRCERCPSECDVLDCQEPGCLGEEPYLGEEPIVDG